MDSTISISTVLSIVFGILAAASTVGSVLLKFSFTAYQKNIDERHAAMKAEIAALEKSADDDEKELKKEVKALTEANHALDKTCIKLNGDVNLLNERHSATKGDIEQVREHMVTKAEWDSRMNSVDKTLETLLRAVQGPYRSHPSGSGYPRAEVRQPLIPRTDTNPPKGTSR